MLINHNYECLITSLTTLSPSIPPSCLSLALSLSVAGVVENLESGGFFSEKVSKACLFSSIHDAVLHCQTDRAKMNKDDEVKHTNTHGHDTGTTRARHGHEHTSMSTQIYTHTQTHSHYFTKIMWTCLYCLFTQMVIFKHLFLWGLGVGCWQLCFSI
jgi:hypothetical protein